MTRRSLYILVSPGFLVGLSVLVLNDFVFKQHFHNDFTGKLSDFAGLFVFPLFFAAFFPRLRTSIYVLTAILFIFWKSVCSQVVIDYWNSLSFFSIVRTVDYSDLVALGILPFSYVYSRIPHSIRSPSALIYLIAVVSIFAFTATSYHTRFPYNNEYRFANSKKDLFQRMSRLSSHDVKDSIEESDTFNISFDSCTHEATFTLYEKDGQSVITLREIDYRCPGGSDMQEMLKYFEKEFIDKLREEPITKSFHVQYIWSTASNDRLHPTPKQSGTQVSPSPR